MLQYFEKAQNFMACTAFLLMNSNSSNTKLERRRNIENINPRRLSLNLVITFLWLNSSMLLYVKLAQFVPFKGLIHRNAGGSWSCSVCCLEWFICCAAAAWWAAVSVCRAVLIVVYVWFLGQIYSTVLFEYVYVWFLGQIYCTVWVFICLVSGPDIQYCLSFSSIKHIFHNLFCFNK